MNNLSKRPFLIITFTQKPHADSNTRVRGWATDGKWDVNENMVIVDRVKNRHLREAHVILDLLGGKVIKSRYEESAGEVFETYYNRYRDDIVEAVKTWGRRDPANIEYMVKLSEDRKASETPAEPEKDADEQTDSN